jgi:hypothetical protein
LNGCKKEERLKREQFELTQIGKEDVYFRHQSQAIGSIVEPCGQIQHLGNGWWSGDFRVLGKEGSSLVGDRFFERIKLKRISTVKTERRDKR